MTKVDDKAQTNITIQYTDTTVSVSATAVCQVPLYLTPEERAKLPLSPQYQHLQDQVIESLRQIALGHAAYQSGDRA